METAAAHRLAMPFTSKQLLKASARFWFAVAAIGQLLFVFYITGFYGRTAIQGDFAAWNKVLPHGIVKGDSVGNVVLGLHLFFAAVITLGGILQLIPQIRAYAPRFHRWNGRVYLISAVIMAVGGLHLIWTRGFTGGTSVGITVNALLILLCAYHALKNAVARQFAVHQRWALRLFLVVSGVWFFRVGLMFSIFLNKGPFGFDPATFQGPFLDFLGVAQYAIPLMLLQLYFVAKDGAGRALRITTAFTLFACTIAMGVGISVVVMGMWLPRL